MAKTYVNLDAQWLAELAAQLDVPGTGSSETARLLQIADHLESMDEKLRNLQSARTYEDGRRDERIAMLGRSNLPVQSVEINPELAKAIAAAPVKKIPAKTKAPKERPEEFKELDALLLDIDLDDF